MTKYLPDAVVKDYKDSVGVLGVDSLDGEIKLLRAKLIALLEMENLPLLDEGRVVSLIESIRRLMDTKKKMSEKASGEVSFMMLDTLVSALIGVIEKYVTDQVTKKRISEEMVSLLGESKFN